MNISKPFILRPAATTLIMCAILFFGIFAYTKLPVSDLPNVATPTISVSASKLGGSPKYMADLITSPLERNLISISGLKIMSSNSSEGSSEITLNFDLDVDLSAKQVEVQSAIARTIPQLPPLASPPTYTLANPAAAPIIYLSVTSETATYPQLYEYVHNYLSQPLSMIRGVAKAKVEGDQYAIRVKVDPLKMASHNVDFVELTNILRNANPNLPGGKIFGEYETLNIESLGQISTPEKFGNVIIKEKEDTALFVSDVADVISSSESRNPFFKYYDSDGKPINFTMISISRLPSSNTIDIARAVETKVEELKGALPKSMTLFTLFNRATSIVSSIKNVQITLLISLALVVLVIFFSLGKITDTIIPSLVLPMAIICTFILMYLLGFSIDNLSLLALTLSVGFVIDDSIVVLENIVHHLEDGDKPLQAALHGSHQISVTVVTMSVALSAIFIPFIWMPGIIGRMFHEFAITLVCAIYCSGFISLTLNPMLCSRFLKTRTNEKPNFSSRINKKLVKWYMRSLKASFNCKIIVLLIGLSSIAFSYWFLTFIPINFLPTSNIPFLTGEVLTHEGSSQQNTTVHAKKVFETLAKNKWSDGFTGLVTGNQSAPFFINLKDTKGRPLASQIARDLTQSIKNIPGIDAFMSPYPFLNLGLGNFSSEGSSYQYILYTLTEKALIPYAELMTTEMKKLPGFTNVHSSLKPSSPIINVDIDRFRAGRYNITANQIETTLQSAYSGGALTNFSKGSNFYKLIVETDPKYNLLASDLDLLYIKGSPNNVTTSTGTISSALDANMVPLTSVADWTSTTGYASVSHFNSFPSATISFGLEEGLPLSEGLQRLDALQKKLLPGTVLGSVQGTAKVFIDTFKQLRSLVILAIIVIYLLLGILYESFIHPLTILSALPPALFGGLLTLIIFDQTLSLYAAIGMIVLIGLVQKNGIMLVDFALEHLKDDKTVYEAVMAACKNRFRPIIMTTIAAIMGAVPVAIGIGDEADVNRPLGLVIVGGLLFSQLITLYVTPVIFYYMQTFAHKVSKKKEIPA